MGMPKAAKARPAANRRPPHDWHRTARCGLEVTRGLRG
jgi:hypothetical protein